MELDRVKRWGDMLIIEGTLAALFGILILVWPGVTLGSLVWLAAAYLVTVGVVKTISGIVDLFKVGLVGFGEIVLGVLAFILGILIFSYPGVSLITYVVLIGIWLIIHGLKAVFFHQKDIRILAIIMGILTIVVGLMLLNRPIVSSIWLFWILGLYFIITGPLLIAQGIAINKMAKR